MSTKVKSEAIPASFEDEFGVSYSIDGKRLMVCENKDLESYDIKEGTEVIGVMSFRECTAIKHINIPNTVKTIERYAFSDCSSLQQLTIPSSMENIEVNPFCNNRILELRNDSPHFVIENEMLIDKRNNCLIYYLGNKKTPSIPNWVNIIGDEAFAECDNIQQIALPHSVTSLGYMAFCGCRSLLQIIISDSVTDIGYEAFCNCCLLQKVIIPESVTSIKPDAFRFCTYLRKIIVPYGNIPKFQQMLDKSVWDLIQYAQDSEERFQK